MRSITQPTTGTDRDPGAGDAPDREPDAAGAPVHGRAAAITLLVLLSIVWGVHWPIVKIGLETMPPLTFATMRVCVGLATVVGVLAARGQLQRPSRSDLPVILSVGVGQIGASVVIQSIALQVVAAGRSAVLYYTMPLWVAVELAVFFRIRPRRADLVGIVLGVAGLTLLLNPSALDWGRPAELAGTGLLLLYAVIWAGVTIHVRRHRWVSTPFVLQPWQLLAALVPIALLASWREGFAGVVWSPQTVLVLLYGGILATAFAFWASQAVTRAIGAQASAIGMLAAPVIGLISGSLLLGEPLTIVDLLGFALVLAGVALASLWRSGAPGRRREPAAPRDAMSNPAPLDP